MRKYLVLLCFMTSHNIGVSQDCRPLPISVQIKLVKEDSLMIVRKDSTLAIWGCNCLPVHDSTIKRSFDVSVKIKNNSKKKIRMWLMTCAWMDNFIVNNDYINIRGAECDSNYPELIEFEPNERKQYDISLTKSIKFECPCNTDNWFEVEDTKLGLILIDDIFAHKLNQLTYHTAIRDKSVWKIVWSNPLHLLGKHRGPQVIGINKKE